MKKHMGLILIVIGISIFGLIGCGSYSIGNGISPKGSLDEWEVETIVKNIVAESNLCSGIIYASKHADYSIESIDYVNDSYDRYLVTVVIKASNGKEYENHLVNVYFRYNPTTEYYHWAQDMIFFDDYPIKDFKKSVNWGKEATVAADEESFREYRDSLDESEEIDKKSNTNNEKNFISNIEEEIEWTGSTEDIENNTNIKWDYFQFAPAPFSIKDFWDLQEVNENWYDNGIFSTYMSMAYPKDKWEYVADICPKMKNNPYSYSGFEVYIQESEETQRIYWYLVPISPVNPPEVYVYDTISNNMKLVFLNGELSD